MRRSVDGRAGPGAGRGVAGDGSWPGCCKGAPYGVLVAMERATDEPSPGIAREDQLARSSVLYPSLRRFAAVVAPAELEPDDLVHDALTRTLATGSAGADRAPRGVPATDDAAPRIEPLSQPRPATSPRRPHEPSPQRPGHRCAIRDGQRRRSRQRPPADRTSSRAVSCRCRSAAMRCALWPSASRSSTGD